MLSLLFCQTLWLHRAFLIILLLGGGDNGFFCGQEEDHEALCGTFHCTSLVSNLMPWRPDGMQVFLPKLAPGDFR